MSSMHGRLQRFLRWACLTATCLTAGTAWGQFAAPEPATGQPFLRMPQTAGPYDPADRTAAITRLPNVTPASAAHVAELESRLAELEAIVREQTTAPKDGGYVVGSDTSMDVRWNYGLEASSKNKDFRIHVGGRTQVDTTGYSGSGNIENSITNGGLGPLMDATNFRRGRLRVDGTMYEVIEFACEYDFVNESDVMAAPSLNPPQSNPSAIPAITDLWVTITQLPVAGNLRIGSFKDPYGFEHLTSSRYLNFMERSFHQDLFEGAFNNGFLPGIMFFNTALDDRMTWAIGEFKNTNNIFDNGIGDGELETCGRITYLPVYKDDGRYLIHMGSAAKYKETDEGQVRYRARGNLRSGAPSSFNPVFVNSGNVASTAEYSLSGELVSVWGPWTVQSEYFAVFADNAVTIAQANPAAVGLQPAAGTAVGTYFVQGCYVEVLYFLTGENRPYNRKTGVFDRVVPYNNFFLVRDGNGNLCSGWGAWQIGARFAHSDLNDSGIFGGELNSFTLGINWFLNPNMKIQANYDLTDRKFINGLGNDGSGQVHGFGMRLAFDF